MAAADAARGIDAGPMVDAGPNPDAIIECTAAETRSCSTGMMGPCAFGIQTCCTDTFGDCVPDVTSGLETCDLTDNDCDDMVDEDFALDTDVDNCGGCGNSCIVLNATPECVGGMCGYTMCDSGFADIVPGTLGCEYTCPVFPPEVEACNALDDDCDGIVDELPIVGLGDPCTPAEYAAFGDTGDCEFGTTVCVFGVPTCQGYVPPTTESCLSGDEDCDGSFDESLDCTGCAGMESQPCSTGLDGICDNGTQVCSSGVFGSCIAPTPEIEICDTLDNDCDGSMDEATLPPPVGTTCGGGGACTAGTVACVSGDLECTGMAGGMSEVCNGLDDDCDLLIDEAPLPGTGMDCTDPGFESLGETGDCEFGATACVLGTIVCQGYLGPVPEQCRAGDSDCDGAPDEGLDCDGCP